ncbi:SUMF1/EgtB/PvdO family nonheme iron enzyme [Vibrio sonorensis]|uniref:SUMF1/EgtB/PvdO family nonheme iron enzyme n=1 Tax=Vibrio sonorensis TaxID=1004316 RepID=UPI0008D98224|nr:SUMF1/EgtB/PvdO family nonheme iron enzyme [Vibrio sonorensis]
MRQGIPALLLALGTCLGTLPVQAEQASASVVAIDDQLFTRHSELSEAHKARDEQREKVEQQEQQVADLEKNAKALDEALAKAKRNLERDYERVIDDPSVDISKSQQAYQDAWASVKQNQKTRLESKQSLDDLKLVLSNKQSELEQIQQSIHLLDESKLRARANRLKEELSNNKTLNVSFTNRCQANLTIAQCDAQTRELTLQKAVKQFKAALIEDTTEAVIAKQNANKVPLNIHVLRHSVKEAGFYDGVRYRNILGVVLEARPSESAACKLLGIKSKYCFAPGYEEAQRLQEIEVAWVNLTVRSNQYGDRVTINDVNYGSTPVDIMLPMGQHEITIEKEGYKSFNRTLSLRSDQTLRANLVERANVLRAGDKFADTMKAGPKGPELITLVAGEYLTGEHGSKQIHLDHAFGIGATPITVSQFEVFVGSTNYQTDAELKNTCNTIRDGDITPIAKSYWRDPGFKQTPDSPVVCVSRNDAIAYAKWLSKQTGYNYRLPDVDEWEIAARSGSQAAYWWGNKFLTGKANTGWSGTPWSNQSTSPVTAFEANRYGIYDTVGNVWQWTEDSRGVAKGGAWNFAPSMASAHQKLFLAPSATANYVGFRVVREIN